MSGGKFLWVPMRVWEGISGAAALFGAVAVIVGGLFALFEYWDRQNAARAAQTLQMIEVWETRGAEDAYLALAKILEAQVKGVHPTEVQNDERKKMVRDKIAQTALASVGGADSYLAVTQFFTRLSLCIQADLCSEDVAATFFSQTLSGFRSWFGQEIEARRETTPNHAMEMDRLLCRFAEADPSIAASIPEVPCGDLLP